MIGVNTLPGLKVAQQESSAKYAPISIPMIYVFILIHESTYLPLATANSDAQRNSLLFLLTLQRFAKSRKGLGHI